MNTLEMCWILYVHVIHRATFFTNSALAEVPSYFYILKVVYAFFSETGTAIKSCENTSELLVGYILENKIFKLMTDHSKRMWRNSDISPSSE